MERKLSIKDAINEAISQSMAADDNVFIMGEDIVGGAGRDHETAEDSQGGAFGVSKGLVKQFGRKRVIDTPISETAFVGLGIGAAHAGLRPIIEIMYVDFVGVCFDQIMNQASKLYYMYGGKHSVPMVIRTTEYRVALSEENFKEGFIPEDIEKTAKEYNIIDHPTKILDLDKFNELFHKMLDRLAEGMN